LIPRCINCRNRAIVSGVGLAQRLQLWNMDYRAANRPQRLQGRAVAAGAERLCDRYRRVRAATVELAADLEADDQVVQVAPETSPTKWHLAHTTWFFERFVLQAYDRRYEPVDPHYEYLFNSYYRGVGEMQPRAQRALSSRPTLDQVHDYRNRVDDALFDLVASRPDETELSAVVELGINHEEQHQELLLTDAKRVLFANPIAAAYRAAAAPPRSSGGLPHEFRFEPAGFSQIGAGDLGFAFDNERPRHREWLEQYALGNRPVTNAEFREFICDGGYDTPRLWYADGWDTVRTHAWRRPLYWSDDLGAEFTLGGWRTLDDDAPVCHVSYYEAAAFACWAGARLPSEAEWESVAQESQSATGNFLATGWLHPAPATAQPGAPGRRYVQLYGDVWEWCASPYRPYPKFRPLPGALGEYNGKFMCNQLIARGGSCVTPAGHIRASYRNFFYPQDRWQFFGLRLARDA
jgi:ergothioneine biosynthesis protein EgtB